VGSARSDNPRASTGLAFQTCSLTFEQRCTQIATPGAGRLSLRGRQYLGLVRLPTAAERLVGSDRCARRFRLRLYVHVGSAQQAFIGL